MDAFAHSLDRTFTRNQSCESSGREIVLPLKDHPHSKVVPATGLVQTSFEASRLTFPFWHPFCIFVINALFINVALERHPRIYTPPKRSLRRIDRRIRCQRCVSIILSLYTALFCLLNGKLHLNFNTNTTAFFRSRERER